MPARAVAAASANVAWTALVSDGCRRAYGSYWTRVTDQWGSRRINEPTPSEIRQLVQHVRANVVPRRDSRGGRSAAEHCAQHQSTARPPRDRRPCRHSPKL